MGQSSGGLRTSIQDDSSWSPAHADHAVIPPSSKPSSKDNIMMARTWNLLDQSSYPLLLAWQSQLSSLSFQFELRNQGTFGCCLLRRSAVGAELFHVQTQLGLEEVDVKCTMPGMWRKQGTSHFFNCCNFNPKMAGLIFLGNRVC